MLLTSEGDFKGVRKEIIDEAVEGWGRERQQLGLEPASCPLPFPRRRASVSVASRGENHSHPMDPGDVSIGGYYKRL